MAASLLKFKSTTARSQPWHIGINSQYSTRYWVGSYGEIIMTDGSESADEEVKIEAYLAHKWDLEANLPSDHLYKNQRPMTYPSLLTALANDPDDSSTSIDANDTLELVFDGATNKPTENSKSDIDAFVSFGSNVLGANYSGSWNATGNVLTITVLDATGANAGVGQAISILAAGNLTFSGNTVQSESSTTVTGDFGL